MLVQPRLLDLDTLQKVEEVQLLRSNVSVVDTVIGLGASSSYDFVQGLCVFYSTIKSVVWRNIGDGLY
jgi:hypothetical protein